METAQSQSCVAYYRVSTQRQGMSGLGLEAQQIAVRAHLDKTSRKLIAELVEIESGKNPDRPKLSEALTLCRLTRSKLIVARLDRLARNVAFVSRLMEAGVDFEAVDFPQANRLTIHILAAVAEYESRLISERTKASLAAAKARGVVLGRRFPPRGHLPGLEKARRVSKEKLAARTADLAPVIAEIRAAGFVSADAVARELTARGIRPVRADKWAPNSARAVLQRLSLQRNMSEARQARRAATKRWAAYLAPTFSDFRQSGHRALTSIGRELNARGVPTFQGGRWTRSIMQRALACLPEDQAQSIYITRKEFESRLRPVIAEIQAAGKTGTFSIASALNARGVRRINGGFWQRGHVRRLLKRLSMFERRTMADWLPGFALIFNEVREAGHLSYAAIASELNARGVRECFGGAWTTQRVRAMLREMRRHKIEREPWLAILSRIIKEICEAGPLSTAAIANELNARGVRICRDRPWTIRKVGETLREMRKHKIDYEPWIASVARIITDVRAGGHLSPGAMANELDARGVRACRGGRWTAQKIRGAFKEMRRCKIEYGSQEVALAMQPVAAKAKKPHQKGRVRTRKRPPGRRRR